MSIGGRHAALPRFAGAMPLVARKPETLPVAAAGARRGALSRHRRPQRRDDEKKERPAIQALRSVGTAL
jgi:hypothetical protein